MASKYLQVIWTKKCLLKWKDFEVSDIAKAFALFERVGSAQIVLRGGDHETSFTSDNLERPFDLWVYGTHEQRLEKFLEWLKEREE